jgi:hypothetical protein
MNAYLQACNVLTQGRLRGGRRWRRAAAIIQEVKPRAAAIVQEVKPRAAALMCPRSLETKR